MSLFKKKRSEVEYFKAKAELLREEKKRERTKERELAKLEKIAEGVHLIRNYVEERGYITNYPNETIELKKEIVEIGQDRVRVHADSLTQEEVMQIADKLDLLVSRHTDEVTSLVLKNIGSIINLVRIVKYENHQDFKSSRGIGNELDIRWLESFDIGSKVLADDNTGYVSGVSDELREKINEQIKTEEEARKKGLYEEKERQCEWLSSDYFAGETKTMIPEQVMSEYAGVLHLGILNRKYKTKQIIGYASWRLSGTKSSKMPFKYTGKLMEFEYPIMVLPEHKQELEVMSIDYGDTKLELVSLLVLSNNLNVETEK